MINPPISVWDPDDLTLFNSVSTLESYIEWQDVEAGIDQLWDATGRVLALSYFEDVKGIRRVVLSETDVLSPESLREILIQSISASPRLRKSITSKTDLEVAPLSRLLEILSPYAI